MDTERYINGQLLMDTGRYIKSLLNSQESFGFGSKNTGNRSQIWIQNGKILIMSKTPRPILL